MALLRSRMKKGKGSTRSNEEDFSVNLTKQLDDNLKNLNKMLDNPSDLVIRELTIGSANHRCAIVFIDGLIDKKVVDGKILKNLQTQLQNKTLPSSDAAILDEVQREIISVSHVEQGNTLDDVSNSILSGGTAFYLDGINKVLIMNTMGWETRSIQEPITESLIRGPREGFVENIGTNMVLIRRYIRDSNLRFTTYKVGRRSKKALVLAYVDGIVHPDIVKELKRRLESIDMDDAPESGYIEQWIEDSFLSPFPQIFHTERPDKVSAALLQGKAAILLDGTPFVLTAPSTLGNSFQSPEDYYERWFVGTLIRMLRYGAAFIAMFLPALYIALVSYQPGMIPSKLAFSIAATREGVPFPSVVEAISMGLTMELLREAGVRLPKTIGQTIGIVGGLVIGDAAVQAGIVSPIMVIVVALTAIASFALPSYSIAISFRMIRFGFMIAASVLGLYGVILLYIVLNIHIVNLKSIGVPYTTPFAPSFVKDWLDLVVRAPLTMLTERPKYTKPNDSKPMDKGEKKQ
ncbi:spore germination protein [Aquibacillus sp. 3ASR75-11]|uniref:Spore germination protein n=2 Tax=Terrihalobacillus insolitus TaxID=2950438 RepID=A0A9X3WU43_9BACI|nr:spore germination protein [Terrihalobacillus insolitus]MDC3413590.1 spore germination protein [Terrihalobacillus insolitus]MDC3424653.1 spore germination protein [Terrihalobacillus insolitus]